MLFFLFYFIFYRRAISAPTQIIITQKQYARKGERDISAVLPELVSTSAIFCFALTPEIALYITFLSSSSSALRTLSALFLFYLFYFFVVSVLHFWHFTISIMEVRKTATLHTTSWHVPSCSALSGEVREFYSFLSKQRETVCSATVNVKPSISYLITVIKRKLQTFFCLHTFNSDALTNSHKSCIDFNGTVSF